MSQSFQSQVISFIYEGVFERFPQDGADRGRLRLAAAARLAPRYPLEAAAPGSAAPQAAPVETIRDHIWLTTQPVEEPHHPEHFVELLEQGNLYDR